MKKNIFIVSLCMLVSIMSMAQSNSNFTDKLMLEFNMGTSTIKHNTLTTIIDTKLGYKVKPYLSIYADYENTYNIEGKGDMRHVYYTNALGGGGCFDFLSNEDKSVVISLCGSLGTTVGNVDFKQTNYKVGMKVRLSSDKIHPTIEFGYRRIIPRYPNNGNTGGLYATIGICF